MQVKDLIEFTQDIKSKQNLQDLEEFFIQLIESKPFGDHKFYIHSFPKDTENPNVTRLLHHPRLTKPRPTPNTKLFRVDPKHPGEVKVMWILPGQEHIDKFKKGKVFEDETVNESVRMFLKNREQLWQKEPDDLSDEEIMRIYASKSGKAAFYPFL